MADLVCFGEIMLRLSTPGHLRFGQAAEFTANYGGAEANVAVSVAQFGGSAAYVTRLPDNELADRALAELRGLRVDVERVVRGGSRVGVYFLEHGASLRPTKVIYDRAHSAMAEAEPAHFDWDAIFAGARRFHWSGITPALSPAAAETCAQACAAARAKGLIVSFDLNYRAKLWSPAEAGRVLAPLMRQVDLCITSAEEARTIFGLDVPADAPDKDERAARALCAEFGFETVALTTRQSSSADETEWGAMLYANGQAHPSQRLRVGIVDRLGAGDAFSGALLFSLMRGDAPQRAIEFAVAASALQHTIYGDYNLATLAEVEALVGGAGGGRVQR